MSITSLISSLYKIGAIQFGQFTLKSNEVSPIYFNLRKIIAYPSLLKETAEVMYGVVSDCKFDLVCGVPYAALPIATCISIQHHIPMIMRRKEKKEYGTKQLIEGEFKEGQRVLVIEDVITTGNSLIETADSLENEGLIVSDVLAFLCREKSGMNQLSQKYRAHTVIYIEDILNTLLNSNLLSDEERSIIKQFKEEKSLG